MGKRLTPLAGYSKLFNRHDDRFTWFLIEGYFYCCAYFFFLKICIVYDSRISPPTELCISCSTNLYLQGLVSMMQV